MDARIASGRRGNVTAPHALAIAAGRVMLAERGNAIEAAMPAAAAPD